jgi:two-component system LytT family response regulator
MINVVIVEKKATDSHLLKKLLGEVCPSVEIHGIACDISSGYALILKIEPDLVFLDIELSGGNGFDLLEQLTPLAFEVIFITASNEYALKAFKYNAVDYLLKPVIQTELVHAVQRAEARIRNRSSGLSGNEFSTGSKALGTASKIGLPIQDGFVFLDPKEITRCEASGAYSTIYYGQGKKLLLSKNLKELEVLLHHRIFCRVHHSCIINLDKVNKYFRGKGGEIEMEDGSVVAVSARKKKNFLDKYSLYTQHG